MNTNSGDRRSLIKKAEQHWDDLVDLRKRRPWLASVIVLTLLVLAIDWGIARFSNIPSLKAELKDVKRERDSKAAQLAPFLAMANQKFPSAPPDTRLELLSSKLETGLEKLEQLADEVAAGRAKQPHFKFLLNNKPVSQLSAIAEPLQGDKLKLNFEVQNVGDISAEQLTVSFFFFPSEANIPLTGGWQIQPPVDIKLGGDFEVKELAHYMTVSQHLIGKRTRFICPPLYLSKGTNQSLVTAAAISAIARGLDERTNVVFTLDPRPVEAALSGTNTDR